MQLNYEVHVILACIFLSRKEFWLVLLLPAAAVRVSQPIWEDDIASKPVENQLDILLFGI